MLQIVLGLAGNQQQDFMLNLIRNMLEHFHVKLLLPREGRSVFGDAQGGSQLGHLVP